MRYAETHREAYRRIEVIAKIGNALRVLDLTEPSVRKAVFEGSDARSLYEGAWASEYVGVNGA